jgi:lipid-A-disaccharide synthase
VRTIGAAVDLVLCLLPFETDFYAAHGVRAEFVGHPLADAIPLAADRAAARRALQLPADGVLVALLPGSRMSEVSRLAAPFVAAARHIQGKQPGWGFVAPMASPATREAFAKEIAQLPGAPAIHVIDGQAQAALAAADAVIVASGTATLETLLTGRPMVVAYKTSALTAFLLRTVGLVKVRYFSQPNLLAGRGVVPEFFQEQVSGEVLGDALLQELSDRTHVAQLLEEFSSIHRTLRRGGAARAADAVLSLLAPAPGRIDARA